VHHPGASYPTHIRNTIHAIRQINDFENDWKIQTNIQKFRLINIGRLKTADVIINDRRIEYKRRATILGQTFTTHGLSPQATQRRAIATKTLTRLNRFRDLSTHNKKRLYLTIVRPQLLYPIVPLNRLPKTALSKLQTVQNRGLRFIQNVRLTDRISSRRLHDMTDIPPINVYLHDRATKTWTDLKTKNRDIYERLKPDENEHRRYRFPCSYMTETDEPPQPIYK
jgi:hypothetical protein